MEKTKVREEKLKNEFEIEDVWMSGCALNTTGNVG